MTESVLAVAVHRTGQVTETRYEAWPSPTLGRGDVVVRPSFVGICGSDISQIRGKSSDGFDVTYPHTLGHEWSGVVIACGDDARRFTVGDRVVGHGDLGNNRWFGFTDDGAMATSFVVGESLCFALPDQISLLAAAVIEPFTCVFAGIARVGGIRPGHRVIVFGLGAIGLSAVIQGHRRGATVVAIDPSELRRRRALELGAVAAIDPTAGDLEAQLTELGQPPRADLVIEASGVPAAQSAAIEAADVGGRVLMMGISRATAYPARLGLVQERDLTITSSTGAPKEHWPAAIDFVRSHDIDLETLVTGILPFPQIAEAVAQAEDSSRHIKIVLHPEGERHDPAHKD